jgi:Flp pilus assembly protein TadG
MFAFFSPVLAKATAAMTAGAALAKRLRRDCSGNVAMMFVFMAIPLCGAVGLAVDMGRVYHVAMHTQGALDAAALAAGRVAQLEKTDTLNKASKSASAYYDHAKPTDVVVTKIDFSPNAQQTEFTVTATSWVRTPFLGVLKFMASHDPPTDAPAACSSNYFGCVKLVSKATAQICLNCSDTGGGNSDDGTNLEIAMMLDVTGSMAGQQISDLKAAAKDLIDIVVWGDQSKYTSRVALAPFAPAVNVGQYFTAITGKSDREDNDGDAKKNIHYPPADCINSKGSVKKTCKNDDKYDEVKYIAKYATCVVERTGASKLTDEAPAGAGTYLPTWNEMANSMSTSCTPSSQLVPLTKNTKVLKDTIDGFSASGTTAGQLGTAFAWYLLSPNWNAVWPADSKVTAYGTPKVKKIAVLMTDGEYNTVQAQSYGDGSKQAVQATADALSLCTAMKKNLSSSDPNIEIYTVGFQLTTKASKDMMKACATATDHYYETSTGDGLKAAFRDIALKISKLRLTN